VRIGLGDGVNCGLSYNSRIHECAAYTSQQLSLQVHGIEGIGDQMTFVIDPQYLPASRSPNKKSP
jgi:hypothetical protein